jgi:hypothetical protein
MYPDYSPLKFWDLSFVPGVLGSEKVLAKPMEVGDSLPSPLFLI